MQMFVADSYTKDARALLKQHGIVAATPRALFGNEVAEGLRETIHFFRSLAATSRFDPDEFDRIMRVFRRVEGAANQIRGTLLEFMAAEIARRRFGAHVHMNRTYKAPNGKDAEADVISDDGSKGFHRVQGDKCLQHRAGCAVQAVAAAQRADLVPSSPQPPGLEEPQDPVRVLDFRPSYRRIRSALCGSEG
ncbi:hypothetical protein [Ensifer canadensis]|uniref:hypothetical protein n=1 Tax=Ensifer canadensis TaxID=555315 RepID=UPI0035E3F142